MSRDAASCAASPRSIVLFGMKHDGQPTSMRWRPLREGEPASAVLHARGAQWVPDRPIHLGHPIPDYVE